METKWLGYYLLLLVIFPIQKKADKKGKWIYLLHTPPTQSSQAWNNPGVCI